MNRRLTDYERFVFLDNILSQAASRRSIRWPNIKTAQGGATAITPQPTGGDIKYVVHDNTPLQAGQASTFKDLIVALYKALYIKSYYLALEELDKIYRDKGIPPDKQLKTQEVSEAAKKYANAWFRRYLPAIVSKLVAGQIAVVKDETGTPLFVAAIATDPNSKAKKIAYGSRIYIDDPTVNPPASGTIRNPQIQFSDDTPDLFMTDMPSFKDFAGIKEPQSSTTTRRSGIVTNPTEVPRFNDNFGFYNVPPQFSGPTFAGQYNPYSPYYNPYSNPFAANPFAGPPSFNMFGR